MLCHSVGAFIISDVLLFSYYSRVWREIFTISSPRSHKGRLTRGINHAAFIGDLHIL